MDDNIINEINQISKKDDAQLKCTYEKLLLEYNDKTYINYLFYVLKQYEYEHRLDEKYDELNGIVLCRELHKLFDDKKIYIDHNDYRLILSNEIINDE